MILSALDEDKDWTFGRGRSNYITGGNAIAQKVMCRIRSFKNDNPLNMDDNIDWLYLLSEKNTEQRHKLNKFLEISPSFAFVINILYTDNEQFQSQK